MINYEQIVEALRHIENDYSEVLRRVEILRSGMTERITKHKEITRALVKILIENNNGQISFSLKAIVDEVNSALPDNYNRVNTDYVKRQLSSILSDIPVTDDSGTARIPMRVRPIYAPNRSYLGLVRKY